MKKLICFILLVIVGLSLCACASEGGSFAKDEQRNVISATPNEVFKDVQENEVNAKLNVYLIEGTVDSIYEDYAKIDNLLVYFGTDILVTLNVGDMVSFYGQITEVAREENPADDGINNVEIKIRKVELVTLNGNEV